MFKVTLLRTWVFIALIGCIMVFLGPLILGIFTACCGWFGSLLSARTDDPVKRQNRHRMAFVVPWVAMDLIIGGLIFCTGAAERDGDRFTVTALHAWAERGSLSAIGTWALLNLFVIAWLFSSRTGGRGWNYP